MTRSQTFSGTSLNAVPRIWHVGIKPKPRRIRVSVEKGIEVEVLQNVRILQGAEVQVESRRLQLC
jgi:hypothetical protein